MAGRVNTKFVVILVASVVVVLGAGVLLYKVQFDKTGETHAAAAREFEAEGDWEAAEQSWGRAVGHEKTNVEWLDSWVEALSHITPETETQYRDLNSQLRSIKRQIAVTARTDVDSTIGYLGHVYDSMSQVGGGSRIGVESFSNEVGLMLAYYPEGGAQQTDRDRIRRYRGMAWSLIAGPSSTMKDAEIVAAKDDLHAAISVNPADGEAMRSLVRLIDTQQSRVEADGLLDRISAYKDEKQASVDAVLAVDPENPWGRITAIDLSVDGLGGLTDEAREEARQSMLDSVSEMFSWADEHVEMIDGKILERLTILESVLDPAAGTPRAISLYEQVVTANNDQTDLLLQLASLRDQAGDFDGAMADARRAEAQEWLPVSLEGYIRLYAQRRAPMLIAEFAVSHINDVETEQEVEELLAIAGEARDRFVAGVGQENLRVLMLDGQIAAAHAQHLLSSNQARAGETTLNDALGYFSKYNELTQFSSREGLWREGLTAIRLNKTGLAKKRFTELLKIEPKNPNVLLGLADVEEMLGTTASLQEALRYTERAAALAPTNESIQARLKKLGLLTFKQKSDDPIEAIVFESERLWQGVDSRSPDALNAEKVLRDGMEEHGQEPRLVRQLVRVLMFTDRLDEARAIAEEAAAANPEDELLMSLKKRLEATSIVDIIYGGIEGSNASDLDKLLQKVEVARQYGEPERALELLAAAIAISPDDPDVIEQEFLSALGAKDIETARVVAERAKALNADRLDGITFQARILAAEGNHAQSAELLREAVARRSSDAPLWRLLASEQAAMGRVAEAIESFRKALGITVNDSTTIRGYIALLATSGQMQEALSESRRLRDFGEADPVFMDIHLRLEATEGGDEGLATAIRRRRQIAGERPFDAGNKMQLSRLYMQSRQWSEAKKILDDLEAEGVTTLARVEALAKWYADQGRVKQDEEYRDGIELARGAFIEYIISNEGEGSTVDAYIAMARFMLDRGRDDVALRAVEEARAQQDPARMRAEKLFGEIMLRRNQPRQAAETFRKIVEAGADNANDSYRKLLIEMLLRINEHAEAGEQIAKLGESAQNDLTVLMQRADIAMAAGDNEEALRLVDRAIELNPSLPLPFIKRAQFLMPNEALSRDVKRNLEEALRLNPNDYQAHKLMATMYYKEKNQNEAIKSLRASLRANPNQDSVLVGILIELIEDNRVGEAIDVANEVIDARPTDATLMLVTGRVFMRRDEFDRAAGLFERAWDLTRDQRVAMAYIDALLRSESPKVTMANRVIQELEVLGAKVDEDPQLLATRAAIEARNGKMARATSFLTRAYEQALGNPGQVLQWFRNVRIALDDDGGKSVQYIIGLRDGMPAGTIQRDWLTYGSAQIRIQDQTEIEEAESSLLSLQAETKNDLLKRLAYRMLGVGRYGREDYAGAEQAWKSGIEAFPDDWEMHNNLAYCIGIDQGRPAEGVPLARQATQLADGRADVYDTLGKLLLKTGALDEAEDALLKAKERVRTERERVNVLLNQARLAIARGNPSEARRLWSQAETTVYTLPDLREVVSDDLAEVKQQIDSAPSAD